MKIYYNLSESRDITVISTVYTEQTPYNAEFFNAIFPDKLDGYQVVNGTLEYSEELYESKQKAKEHAEAVKKAEDNVEYLKYKQFLESLDDADALTVALLYPHWSGNGILCKEGSRFQDDGVLYKVLKTHVSQETWKPKDAPSLFAKVLTEDPNNPDSIPAWEQPDSTNGFMTGDKVQHNEKVWESLVDNNTWEPGVVGTESLWKEVEYGE